MFGGEVRDEHLVDPRRLEARRVECAVAARDPVTRARVAPDPVERRRKALAQRERGRAGGCGHRPCPRPAPDRSAARPPTRRRPRARAPRCGRRRRSSPGRRARRASRVAATRNARRKASTCSGALTAHADDRTARNDRHGEPRRRRRVDRHPEPVTDVGAPARQVAELRPRGGSIRRASRTARPSGARQTARPRSASAAAVAHPRPRSPKGRPGRRSARCE